jgi:hypothetical protein
MKAQTNCNPNRISPVFRNLAEGTYGLYINRELFNVHSVTEAGGNITATVVAGREELDLVLLQDRREKF